MCIRNTLPIYTYICTCICEVDTFNGTIQNMRKEGLFLRHSLKIEELFFFINGWKVEILINSTELLKYYIQNMWKNKNDHLSTVNDNDNKVKVHLGLLTLRFKGHKKSIFIIMSNFIILRNNWYMEFEILSFSDYEFNFDI